MDSTLFLFYILGAGDRPTNEPEPLPLILSILAVVGVLVILNLVEKPKK